MLDRWCSEETQHEEMVFQILVAVRRRQSTGVCLSERYGVSVELVQEPRGRCEFFSHLSTEQYISDKDVSDGNARTVEFRDVCVRSVDSLRVFLDGRSCCEKPREAAFTVVLFVSLYELK